jgi:hypothetical protein
MFSAIRRHLSYANVVATLALVFAMSGGALAAKHYLINSTKQLNPKVLKALRGNKGATGRKGATGAAGLAGVIGPRGTNGVTGAAGATGPAGPTYSAFATGSAEFSFLGAVVVSVPINPPFGGNLLVQASGFTTSSPIAALVVCEPDLGEEEIGDAWLTHVAAESNAGLAVTGARTVAAGPNTVSVRCRTGNSTEHAIATLTMTALVTGK